MGSEMKVDYRKTGYSQYAAVSAKEGKEAEQGQKKEAVTDSLVLHQEEEDKIEKAVDYYEQWKEQKKAKEEMPKKKVESSAAFYKMQILSSTNSLMVRMALGKAFAETASLSMCKYAEDYDRAQVERALSQLKKVVRAGQLKVKNLTAEEHKARQVLRQRQQEQIKEAKAEKQKLETEKRKHRKKEELECKGQGGESGDNPLDKIASSSSAGVQAPQVGETAASVSAEPIAADVAVSMDAAAVSVDAAAISVDASVAITAPVIE